jgi:RNA polymerase sigma-70 factor (ECF subfamily)
LNESGKHIVDRLPDTELMLRVRDGDECAFAEIYRRYHRKLLDFFYGLSSNAQCAEDLCHETFSRIWQVRRRYAATGSFPAYVFTFARNIWLENCRRLRKQQRLGSRRSLEQTDYELAAAVSSHPDEGAARSELSGYILEALDALPEDQRMAFVMRNIEGMAIADIAAVMQCPENTVRSRKILALKKLRVLLQKVAAL